MTQPETVPILIFLKIDLPPGADSRKRHLCGLSNAEQGVSFLDPLKRALILLPFQEDCGTLDASCGCLRRLKTSSELVENDTSTRPQSTIERQEEEAEAPLCEPHAHWKI